MKKRSYKKYRVIAKVGKEKFVKYRVNDLVQFANFLDRNWKGWRWFNVYDQSRAKVGNFTKYNRPLKPSI